MRRVRRAALVVALGLGLGLVVWPRRVPPPERPPSPDAALVAEANRVRPVLAAISRRTPADTELRRRLDAALRAPLPADTAAESLVPLLISLVEAATVGAGGRGDTGYIQDADVVAVLARALGSGNDKLRTLAYDSLLTNAKPAHLQLHTDAILAGLAAGFAPPVAARLEALLLLSPERTRALLADRSLPVEIRARLGDSTAEATLIAAYEATTDPRAKWELARRLGYVGSDAAGRTLAAELASPLVLEFPYEHVSTAYFALEALSRRFPDERLLTVELQRVRARGDDAYGQRRLAAYLRRVARFVERALDVDVEVAEPVMLYQRLVVEHPLPDAAS